MMGSGTSTAARNQRDSLSSQNQQSSAPDQSRDGFVDRGWSFILLEDAPRIVYIPQGLPRSTDCGRRWSQRIQQTRWHCRP
jgi:hypothetical protein